MKQNMRVSVVIGTKMCLECGNKVSAEGYDIPHTREMIEEYKVCKFPIEYEGQGDNMKVLKRCQSEKFTSPKFHIIMKKTDDINYYDLMKRMVKK